jgi:hypothetical protein
MQAILVSAGAVKALLGAALLLAGIAFLRVSWRSRPKGGVSAILVGWGLIGLAFAAFAHVWGAEVGIFYGLLGLSLAGYAVVASGLERRSASGRMPREMALEPEERSIKWTRGIAKSLLAIVLSGIASIGVGVAFAVAMPMAVHDRIMIGGILVPVLWGAGMAWTLSDARLLRATCVLVATSVLGYAIAFLPKVLR